jgi:hypothetical protein
MSRHADHDGTSVGREVEGQAFAVLRRQRLAAEQRIVHGVDIDDQASRLISLRIFEEGPPPCPLQERGQAGDPDLPLVPVAAQALEVADGRVLHGEAARNRPVGVEDARAVHFAEVIEVLPREERRGVESRPGRPQRHRHAGRRVDLSVAPPEAVVRQAVVHGHRLEQGLAPAVPVFGQGDHVGQLVLAGFEPDILQPVGVKHVVDVVTALRPGAMVPALAPGDRPALTAGQGPDEEPGQLAGEADRLVRPERIRAQAGRALADRVVDPDARLGHVLALAPAVEPPQQRQDFVPRTVLEAVERVDLALTDPAFNGLTGVLAVARVLLKDAAIGVEAVHAHAELVPDEEKGVGQLQPQASHPSGRAVVPRAFGRQAQGRPGDRARADHALAAEERVDREEPVVAGVVDIRGHGDGGAVRIRELAKARGRAFGGSGRAGRDIRGAVLSHSLGVVARLHGWGPFARGSRNYLI